MRVLACTTVLLLYVLWAPLPYPCVSLELTVTVSGLFSENLYGDDLNLLLATILPRPLTENLWNLHRLVQFPDYDFSYHLTAQSSLPPEYLQVARHLPRALLPLRPLLKSHQGRTWFLEHLETLPSPIGADDLSLRFFAPAHQTTILQYIHKYQTKHRASSHWCLSLRDRPTHASESNEESDPETEEKDEDGDEEETHPLLRKRGLWLLYDAPCHWMRRRHGRPVLTSVIRLLEALTEEAEAREEAEVQVESIKSRGTRMRHEYKTEGSITDQRDGIKRPNDNDYDGHAAKVKAKDQRSRAMATRSNTTALDGRRRGGEEMIKAARHESHRSLDSSLLLLARLRRALITGVDLQGLLSPRGYLSVRRIPRTPLQVALRFLMEGGNQLPRSMPKMNRIWETLVEALEKVIQERPLLAAAKFELMAYLLTHYPSFRAALVDILEEALLDEYEPLEVSPYAIRQVLAPLDRLPRLSQAWRVHIAQNLLFVLKLPLAGQIFNDQRARASWWRRNIVGMRWRGGKFPRHARALIYLNDPPPLRGRSEEIMPELGLPDSSLVQFGKRGPRFACINIGKIINRIASLWWDQLAGFARGQIKRLPQLSRALRILLRRPFLTSAELGDLIVDSEEDGPCPSHAETETDTDTNPHPNSHSHAHSHSHSPPTLSPLSVASLCTPGTTSAVALRKIIMALYIIYHGLRLAQYGLL